MTATAMKIAVERMYTIEPKAVTKVSPNFSHAGQSVASVCYVITAIKIYIGDKKLLTAIALYT